MILTYPLEIENKDGAASLILYLCGTFDPHYSFRAALAEIERMLAASGPVSQSLPPEQPLEDFVEGTFSWGGREFQLYFERPLGYMQFSSRNSADVEDLRDALLPHISIEPQPSGSADSERAKALARPRTILIAIAVSFLVAGLIEPHLPNAGQPFNTTGVVHALVLAMLLFAWCRSDAIARRVRRPAGATLLVAFIAPIGIPYYFFRTMPWQTAVVATAKAIGFYAGTTALFFAAYYLSS